MSNLNGTFTYLWNPHFNKPFIPNKPSNEIFSVRRIGIHKTVNDKKSEFKYWKAHSVTLTEYNQINFDGLNFCDYDCLIALKEKINEMGLKMIEIEPSKDSLFQCFANFIYPNNKGKYIDIRQKYVQIIKNNEEKLNILSKSHRLNIIIYSLNEQNQLFKKHIVYDQNDKFHTLYLAHFHNLYFPVLPYSNYSIQTLNDLFLITKLAKLHSQTIKNNEKMNKFHQIIIYLQNEIPSFIKPRFDQIAMVTMKQNFQIPISKKVQLLMDIIDRNQLKKTKYEIRMSKNEKNENFEAAIKEYLNLNNLHCSKPQIAINQGTNVQIENLFVIDDENEKKLISTKDINKFVVIGQFLGVLTLDGEYDQIYEGSMAMDDHNKFCFNLRVDAISNFSPFEYWQLNEDKNENLSFDIAVDALRLNKESKMAKNVFLRMKHCENKKNQNVVFVNVYVNDWPCIFLVTKRRIKANEELITFYDADFKKCTEKSNENHEKLRQIEKKKQDILNKYNLHNITVNDALNLPKIMPEPH